MSKLTVVQAVEKVRDTLHQACADMGPEQYMEVLENIEADTNGSMDALKEENPELF